MTANTVPVYFAKACSKRARRDIEVVDGFVQEQKGTTARHQQSQFQAGALAVAQTLSRAKRVIPAEQEEVQEVTGFGLSEYPGTLDGFQRAFCRSRFSCSWVMYPNLAEAPSRTDPETGSSLPAMVRSKVVLPQPFGPVRAMRCPARI